MSVMYDDTETTSANMQGETERAERKAPLPLSRSSQLRAPLASQREGAGAPASRFNARSLSKEMFMPRPMRCVGAT